MFVLASSVCWSLQCLISTLTTEGGSGHLFRLTCSVMLWGGWNTANKYHWCVGGVLTVYGPHWVCPNSQWHVLSQSTLLRLQVALQGCSPKQALHFMQFPDLSCSGSGSWVLHKGTDLVGHAFCDLPRSEKLRRPGAWQAHCPRWACHLNHLPRPGRLVSQVCRKGTISGVPCVSSGELISGCDPPGRYQLSRIPESLG